MLKKITMQNLFHKVRCSFLMSLLLTAIGSLSAQGTLSGIVANMWGQPLSGVNVELFTDDGSRFDDENTTLIATTRTDTMGRYLIEGISAGQYAVRFNHNQADNIEDNRIYQKITVVGCKISDTIFLLDVHLEPMEGFAVYSVTQKPCHIRIRCCPKSHLMAKVEFEVLDTKEQSVLYTSGWVAQHFPAGTGRVKIRIYDHVGKDQWNLRRTMTKRPRK